MNNGHPPYGDPSQWGQQPAAGQGNPAQNPYGQYGQQPGSYQQQPYQQQTYQPQAHQAQENYQQSWQPYGQQSNPQNGYQQPSWQQGYPQGSYQQPYQQQPYQQNAYQQQPYQQEQPMYQQTMQNGQPLQQGYAQPQGYPQQAPSAQPQGQFFPAQGYSGYVTQPAEEDKGLPISEEVIVKVALFGALPVLFLLAVLFKQPVLCWIFLAGAAATVATMWIRDAVDRNLRLISTMICGVLSVVALVVALNGPGPRQQNQQQEGGNGVNAAQNVSNMGGGTVDGATPTPSPTPTMTPDPYAESGAAAEQLQSFFWFWHVNNDEAMLALTAPSWRNSVEDPAKELFTIRANRTPADDMQIVEFKGSEADTMRTARVRVTISRNISGRSPEVYLFDVLMLKEDGAWYVDPRSLKSNVKETTTQVAYNTTPTQPVARTGSPDMVLYYNTEGGSYYHADANCSRIDKKYLPLRGQFLYSQIDEAPYKDLQQCFNCDAPRRPQ